MKKKQLRNKVGTYHILLQFFIGVQHMHESNNIELDKVRKQQQPAHKRPFVFYHTHIFFLRAGFEVTTWQANIYICLNYTRSCIVPIVPISSYTFYTTHIGLHTQQYIFTPPIHQMYRATVSAQGNSCTHTLKVFHSEKWENLLIMCNVNISIKESFVQQCTACSSNHGKNVTQQGSLLTVTNKQTNHRVDTCHKQ